MHKLITAFMAIAAFAALVVAPAASASPVLTSNGVAVPAGTSILWLHTGEIKFTGSFNAGCSAAELKGTVTANTGSKIKGEIPVGSAKYTGTGPGGDCTSALGSVKFTQNSKLCFETVTGTDNVSITGCGGNVTFTLEVTGAGPCKYSTASVAGTFRTGDEDATFTVLEQVDNKEEGGLFCPSSLKTDYDLDAYTTDLTTLTVS